MDVTGVPSTDPGHRSATPVAVAALWSIQRGTKQVGAAPVTVPPTSTIRTHLPLGEGSGDGTCPSERGTLHTRRDPGPPSHGVRDFHAPPDLLVRMLAPRPGGPGPSHAITTAGTLQDGRRHLHGTKDGAQDDGDVRRLSTVPFLQCSTTVPAIRGKTTTSAPLHSCTPPLLTTIKGEGGLPFAEADRLTPIEGWKQVL